MMFGALKYSLLCLLYFSPVKSYDYNSDEYRACADALWYGCSWSDYPHLTQLWQTLRRNEFDFEATVKYVAQVNVRDVCRDLVSVKKCRQDKIASATQECRDQYNNSVQYTANELEMTNYICVEQLNRLVANQKCFADYDLITDISCCGYKIFFSSECSLQKILTCAQQKIRSSRKCRSDALQLFTSVAHKFKSTYLEDRDSCRPEHTREPLEFYKQLF
jgi:hypothetical protein